MFNIFNQLRSRFAHIVPGQVVVIDGYAGKPKNSTWYFIEDLDEVRAFMKRNGRVFTPRFRGPRQTVYNISRIDGKQYRRSECTRKSTCLKDEAKFFSVSAVKCY